MLAFIDESGFPRQTDQTKHPVLACVCVDESKITPLIKELKTIKEKLYGHTNEIKSTRIFKPATILNNYTNNKGYGEAVVSLIKAFDIKVFAIIMDRPDVNVYTPDAFLPKQHQLLLKKIETFCASNDIHNTILVFDSVSGNSDKQLSSTIEQFLFESKFGSKFHHIVGMPLFVNSSITSLIELADICAGLIRIYYEQCAHQESVNEYSRWIKSLYETIETKTVDLKNKATGYVEYGFQHVSNLSYTCVASEG